MMALFVWWFALPAVARRLLGAFLLAASLIAAASFALHRAHSAGYREGHRAGADSAWLADKRKEQIALDSMEHRADSLAHVAQHAESAFHPTAVAGPRIERVDSLVPVVPISQLVRIYVASDSAPHYADAYIGHLVVWYDSIVYKVLLPQRDSAIVLGLAWKRAWGSEHAAREGSDSLTAAYAERLRSVSVSPSAHSHRLVYATIGAVVALVARNQIHR